MNARRSHPHPFRMALMAASLACCAAVTAPAQVAALIDRFATQAVRQG